MADNTEYEQDEVVIVPPQNGGNDDDVSGDGGSGTGGSGGTGGNNGDGGGDDGDGGGDDGGNNDGSGGGDNEGGDGSGGSGSGGSGSGGSGSGGDGGDADGGDTDGGDREGDDKEGDDKDGDGEEGDGEEGDGEEGDGKDKEGEDDSEKDTLIGKEVMLVYVSKAGEMWTVERKIESHNVTTDEYETNKDLFKERDVKVGDVLTFYSLKKGDEETQLHRMDFVLMGDSVAYYDNNSTMQIEEVEQINKTEGTLYLKKLTIRASDVIKSIPRQNEGENEKEDENPDEEFESIVMEIINQLKAEFELASAFPSDLREFCRAHFPKSIYDSIKVLKSTNGENAEELEQRGYDMETIREFDSEVAKMMLSYIQTNGYYFSPQTAFNHLLHDAFTKLGVFTFTNTKLNDQNDSAYFVSISNDDGHLTVYSLVPNTFVQKIVFGSNKNIVKFGLWQDRNVTSKKADDKTKDDYADIDHLYSFLNWVIAIQRKQLEGARVVEHEEINHEIASIYIKQLKALKDATK